MVQKIFIFLGRKFPVPMSTNSTVWSSIPFVGTSSYVRIAPSFERFFFFESKIAVVYAPIYKIPLLRLDYEVLNRNKNHSYAMFYNIYLFCLNQYIQ